MPALTFLGAETAGVRHRLGAILSIRSRLPADPLPSHAFLRLAAPLWPSAPAAHLLALVKIFRLGREAFIQSQALAIMGRLGQAEESLRSYLRLNPPAPILAEREADEIRASMPSSPLPSRPSRL